MAEMYDNYRLIEAAKERYMRRIEDGVELTPEDVVVKIERNNVPEDYYDGFSDYHGPR